MNTGSSDKSKILRKIRLLFLIMIDSIYKLLFPIKVYNTKQTLSLLENQKASISRFGDGEFDFILGSSLAFQEYDPLLASKLEKILKNNKPVNHHLVAVPAVMYTLKEMNLKSKIFWTKYFAQNRKKILPMLDRNFIYYDSQITRIYINRKDKNVSRKYFAQWKNIWKDKRILIVEGEYSRFGVGNDLFKNAKKVRRILCPAKNAFAFYKEIQSAIIKTTSDYDFVLLILGPTATVLAYELAQKNIRALDVGNLDMEYEWSLRLSKKPIALQGKYTIEAKDGTNVEDMKDQKYEEEIIARIGCSPDGEMT